MHSRLETKVYRRRSRRTVLAAVVGLCWQLHAPLTAQPPADDSVDRVRAEIRELRQEYNLRLAALEARLSRLEAAAGRETAPGRAQLEPSDELARLRQAAEEVGASDSAAEPEVATAPAVVQSPVVGRERNLNRLNPEISVTGIFIAQASDRDREEFAVEEVELDLQAALDPFSRTRLTLAFADEEVEIEEGYVVYSSLPSGLELMAGKFRQRFGPLNRQHLHALPQSDYPLALQAYFGEEGLAQNGLSLSWLLARPWASANEITLEFTDGQNEEAFGGEDFEDFSFLGRLENFWELSAATYLEWGLSGIVGSTADDGDSRIWGTDLTTQWRPPTRAKYREITWRTELLWSQRDDALSERQEAWGGYTYLEGLLTRNLYLGLRLDRAEDPLVPADYRWGIVPYFTWWQSEYVRLRAEYGFLQAEPSGEEENRFTLQLTWAAGPHKHTTY
jgi:hypothetical protein